MPDWGKFITVEGIEGVGKTTHIETIRDCLEQRGLSVLSTREPGGTRVGEAVRELLLAEQLSAMHPDTELLLMFAARAEHLHQVIMPALKAGTWVVCDRFTDATYAYQGSGRGIAQQRIAVLEQWVQDELRPNLTLLLDADVETGLSRIKARRAADRFEAETVAFFDRVRRGYLQRAAQEPDRFCLIDASRPLAAVGASIIEALERVMSGA